MGSKKYHDIAGERYGALVAIRAVDFVPGRGEAWLWRCDCGVEIVRPVKNVRDIVRRGCTPTCGPSHLRGKRGRFTSNENHIAQRYKIGAARRDIEWRLTRAQAIELMRQDCHYCGAKPSMNTAVLGGEPFIHNGIDRKDPHKGYAPNNVVPCCTRCNRAKLTMTYDEFIDWLRRVARHMHSELVEQPPLLPTNREAYHD